MTPPPMTEDQWARMSWAARQRFLLAQTRARRELERDLLATDTDDRALVLATLAEARAYLAAQEPDPDAPRHLRELVAATERPRDHGRFARRAS